MQGIPLPKLHIVDALGSGLGVAGGGIADVEREVVRAVMSAKEGAEMGNGEVLLVLDGLDFVLAATGCAALDVMEMVGEVREVCHRLYYCLRNPLSLVHPLPFTTMPPIIHSIHTYLSPSTRANEESSA